MSEKLRGELFWTDRWFASSAIALTLEARGLYREMLTRAWALGGRIPKDPARIQRLLGITPGEFERTWPSVRGYWVEDGDSLYNEVQQEVMDQCLARQKGRTEKAKKAAAARWAGHTPNAPSNAQASAKHMPEQCPPSPSPSPSPEQTPNDTTARSNGFDRFWQGYPKKVGKKAALRAWKTHTKAIPVETILDALAWQRESDKWREGFVPNPATWLNQGRWEDEPEEKSTEAQQRFPENWRDEVTT